MDAAEDAGELRNKTKRQLMDELAELRMRVAGLEEAAAVWKSAYEETTQLVDKLRKELANVKTLRGLLPICASCKNIRDDNGYWLKLEAYIHEYSEAELTHGLCPDCIRKLYPTTILEKVTP